MLTIRHLGLKSYQPVWEDMKHFTANRTSNTVDELWLVQHYPVYTQGQAGKPEHLLNPNSIEVVQSDRGGQITYHGPGQLVVYLLLDINRRKLGIRTLVSLLEQCIINVLAQFGLSAALRSGAPGVYVADKKIASIGLRVKQGRTYHGLALNVDMDLNPFKNINPCGYTALEMTQVKDWLPQVSYSEIEQCLQEVLQRALTNTQR